MLISLKLLPLNRWFLWFYRGWTECHQQILFASSGTNMGKTCRNLVLPQNIGFSESKIQYCTLQSISFLPSNSGCYKCLSISCVCWRTFPVFFWLFLESRRGFEFGTCSAFFEITFSHFIQRKFLRRMMPPLLDSDQSSSWFNVIKKFRLTPSHHRTLWVCGEMFSLDVQKILMAFVPRIGW